MGVRYVRTIFTTTLYLSAHKHLLSLFFPLQNSLVVPGVKSLVSPSGKSMLSSHRPSTPLSGYAFCSFWPSFTNRPVPYNADRNPQFVQPGTLRAYIRPTPNSQQLQHPTPEPKLQPRLPSLVPKVPKVPYPAPAPPVYCFSCSPRTRSTVLKFLDLPTF